MSRDGSLDAEIHLRIQKASAAFGKLEKRVCSDRIIYLKTKIRVYTSGVLITLLYSSETWTTHRRHLKWLERVCVSAANFRDQLSNLHSRHRGTSQSRLFEH